MEKGGSSTGRNITMRSGSRSPSFLAVALLVVIAILAFNYWSLSTRNGELSNELETLQVDFRSISDKHLNVEKHVASLSSQLAEAETKLKQVENTLTEKEKKATDLQKEVDSVKDELHKAQQEAEGAKKEVDKIQQEKNALSGDLENVKKQFKDLQNAPKVCDRNACKEPIRDVIGALTHQIGKPVISGALKQQNVDLMEIAGDLLQGGEQPKEQPAPGAGGGQEMKKEKGKTVGAAKNVKRKM